jgi:hypothetical protein
VTALALQAAVAADTTAAVEAAADFLTAEQNTDGSWPSPFGDPNANTAGVAALALRAAGRDAAADAAAGFVTALQTDDGGIRFTAAEPAANGYATLQGILAFAAVPLPELEIDPFADVAWGDLFDGEIDWLADTDITRGCTPDHFCPDDPVTRGQMAAFLHRALGTTLPTGEATDFTDTTTSVFADDIEWLSATGITRGCTPDHFCPDDPVTRGQMAAFLHRALGTTLPTGEATDFTDTTTSVFADDIEWLSATGITRGCTPDHFCPDDPVTRGQMAAFLHRALGG